MHNSPCWYCRPSSLCQIAAGGIADGLLLAIKGDLTYAVLLVVVEVGH